MFIFFFFPPACFYPVCYFVTEQAMTRTWHLFGAIMFYARLRRIWIFLLYTLDVWKLAHLAHLGINWLFITSGSEIYLSSQEDPQNNYYCGTVGSRLLHHARASRSCYKRSGFTQNQPRFVFPVSEALRPQTTALSRSHSYAYGVVCCAVTQEAQVERTHPALCTHQMHPHHLRPFEVGDSILDFFFFFVLAELCCTSLALWVDPGSCIWPFVCLPYWFSHTQPVKVIRPFTNDSTLEHSGNNVPKTQ